MTNSPDPFQARIQKRRRFLGPICASGWGPAGLNYRNLIGAGYVVKVFLGDREIKDAMSADPDARTVTVPTGTLTGDVEIRLFREARQQ